MEFPRAWIHSKFKIFLSNGISTRGGYIEISFFHSFHSISVEWMEWMVQCNHSCGYSIRREEFWIFSIPSIPRQRIQCNRSLSIATRYGNPDSCLLPNRGFAGTAAKTRQKMGKNFLELRLVDRFNFFIFLNLRRPRARTREQNNVCGYVIIEWREIDWYKDLENLRRGYGNLYGKFLSNHFK